jgi:RNA polymerase sigma factor
VIDALILSFLTVSTGETVEARAARARDGDSQAREDLLRDYTPFIVKTASSAARRYLVTGRDEEVSVGLQAFNEAISAYDSPRPGFLAFAATVIRRRLIDYYRKEKRRDEVPFSSLSNDDEAEEWPASIEASRSFAVDDWSKVLERRDDIEEWKDVLKAFRLTLKDVVEAAPKHVDARERAIRTAVLLARDEELAREFLEHKKLPIDDLVRHLPDEVASRKTLERQKAFITAIAVILTHDLSSLKEFLDLT